MPVTVVVLHDPPCEPEAGCVHCAQEYGVGVMPATVDDRQPPIGTYAFTARLMAEMGIMSGDEADEWKDSEKEKM